MAPAKAATTATGGIFSSSHCTNAPALQQPCQVRRRHEVVRRTELRPPGRHARIRYDGPMNEIERAMSRQRNHGDPKRPSETGYRRNEKHSANQQLEKERMRGRAHDGH